MREKRKKELQEKGWSEKEIRRAEALLEKVERQDVFLSKIAFWSAVLVIVFANVIVSLILIPFLVVLNRSVLYGLVVLLAGTIGFLYTFLITNVGHLERKHHLLAGIIIPLLALANLVVMVIVSNRFIMELKINNPPHNPWLVAGVFAVAFILPYLLDRLVLHFTKG